MQNAKKYPPLPIQCMYQCVHSPFLHQLFLPLSVSLLTFQPPFPSSSPHFLIGVFYGKCSCPWLLPQCLMECHTLWPLAACLCTSCTCLCLTSNSTHSLSRTQKHTLLVVIHTLMQLAHIKHTGYCCLSQQTTYPCVFTLPVYPTFL